MEMHMDVRRHMELFDPYTFDTPVHVIGAGATGSWLVLQLAKLGITDITVYDYDTVEEHNVPNQLFGITDVGGTKAEILAGIVKRDTKTEIKTQHIEVKRGTRFAGVVFCMVDSMAGRREIWDNCIKFKSAVKLFVEPRMGLDVGRVYNVDPMNMKHITEYEKTYYGDDVAEVSACGTSMTVITSAITTAAWCARQLINFQKDGINGLDSEILLDYAYNNIFTTRWE